MQLSVQFFMIMKVHMFKNEYSNNIFWSGAHHKSRINEWSEYSLSALTWRPWKTFSLRKKKINKEILTVNVVSQPVYIWEKVNLVTWPFHSKEIWGSWLSWVSLLYQMIIWYLICSGPFALRSLDTGKFSERSLWNSF